MRGGGGDAVNQPSGPGWWLASDGRWYPPELHPDAPPASVRGWEGLPALGGPTTAGPPVTVAPPPATAPVAGGPPPGWVPPVARRRDPGFGEGVEQARARRRRRRLTNLVTLVVVVSVLAAVGLGGYRALRPRPSVDDFAGTEVPGPPTSLPAVPLGPGLRRAIGETVLVDEFGCTAAGDDYGLGSGWPVTDDEIVTDAHVVGGSREVSVEAPGQPRMLATVVLFDPAEDLAVLRTAGAPFTPLPVLRRTGWDGPAVFMGYPGDRGPDETVSAGTVSAYVTAESYNYPSDGAAHDVEPVVDATLSGGDSGGPVVNADGAVVGMMQAGAYGQGLALPSAAIVAAVAPVVGATGAVSSGTCLFAS